MAEDTRFLVLVSFVPADPQRLMTAVPALKETLEALAIGPIEQLFRSTYADWCGYLVRSRRNARQIKEKLETPNDRLSVNFDDANYRDPFLTNRDSIAVIEVGSDVSATQSLSRAMAWFQHH